MIKNIKQRKLNRVSTEFLIVLLLLLALGTIMIFSASYPYAISHYSNGYFYIIKHSIFLALGIIIMSIMSYIPIKSIKKLSLFYYAFCVLLLVLVLIVGSSEGVAKRWLIIPGTSISFQPSELMKFGVTLMLAWYFDKTKEKRKNTLNTIILPGLIVFFSCGLVLVEKHLSGTMIIAFIGLIVVFLSGASIKKMSIYYGVTALIGATAFLLTNTYALKRIISFFDTNADILSDKWQTTQGLYAIGSGGLFGLGLGNSRQKYSYVSEPQNDFIFSIWCEETGFLGAAILISLFIILIFSGFKIAINAKDIFSNLVSFGIIIQIGIQAMLNMAVVTDLIPNTGISLPFFSYGGSSLVILLAEMGILLSISRQNHK